MVYPYSDTVYPTSLVAPVADSLLPMIMGSPNKMGGALLGDLWSTPFGWEQYRRPRMHHTGGNPHAFTLHFDKNKNSYVLEAPTPGVKREDLKVELVGRRKVELTIEHCTKETEEEKTEAGAEGSKVHCKFVGSMSLPEDADTCNAKVDYMDGMLRLTFPKLAEEDRKKHMHLELEGDDANLPEQVQAKLDKIKELRKQLETELAEAAKAQDRLREAKREAHAKVMKERKLLELA